MSVFDWLFGKKNPQNPAQTPSASFASYQTAILERPQTLPEEAYVLPKNEHEINRLDFQHFILRQVLRGNYMAPVQAPRAILDVGGKTERWCYEIAQAFPQASVMRCDRVETKSVGQEMPQNYKFVQVDILKGLPFPDRSFDFVYQRLHFLTIPTALWPQILRELVRVVNIGGWVELVETRTSGHDLGPYTMQAAEWINGVSRRLGIDPAQVPKFGNDLSQLGLTNVKSYAVPIPLGRWGGRIGTMMASNIVAAQQTIKPMVIAQLGVDPVQFEQCIAAQQQEWECLHSSLFFDFAYGQRSH